jgi:hypothetical protein
MTIDIEHDEKLRQAREQLRQLNLDLKLETLDGDLVVVAFERSPGAKPKRLEDVPPLPYPSPDLAEWVGGVTARITRS